MKRILLFFSVGMMLSTILNAQVDRIDQRESAILYSDECCPDGWYFIDGNCTNRYFIPEGFRPFEWGGTLHVHPDCDLAPSSNDCCPPGYQINGAGHCWTSVWIPSGWDYVPNDTLLMIKAECCECPENAPEGAYYDGNDCLLDITYPAEYDPFVYNNTLYVSPDCSINPSKPCCPPGYQIDPADHCYTNGYVPGNVYFDNGKIYLESECFEISTEDDVCEDLFNASGTTDFSQSWTMYGSGSASICFNPECIPDQLIISINDVEVVNTNSYTNSCVPWCAGAILNGCDPPLSLGCNFLNPWTCFDISWDSGDIITIDVNSNTCGNNQTEWHLMCEASIPGYVPLKTEKIVAFDRSSGKSRGIELENYGNHIIVFNPMENKKIVYQVNSMNGMTLRSGTLSELESIKVDNLLSGIYFLVSTDSEGHPNAQKFIIQK